jgi:hypothetical protein
MQREELFDLNTFSSPPGVGTGLTGSGAGEKTRDRDHLDLRDDAPLGAEDEVEAADMLLHLLGIPGDDHLVRAEIQCIPTLSIGDGEGDRVRAHRMRELDTHMAEPADPDDAHLHAGADLPVAQRRVGRDARAQERGHGSQLLLGMADPEHELVIDDDALRIAAQRVAGLVLDRRIVGQRLAVFAELLQPLLARGAMLTAIDQAADAHGIAEERSFTRAAGNPRQPSPCWSICCVTEAETEVAIIGWGREVFACWFRQAHRHQ